MDPYRKAARPEERKPRGSPTDRSFKTSGSSLTLWLPLGDPQRVGGGGRDRPKSRSAADDHPRAAGREADRL
ncbi:hypothetical protein Ssi02_49310 [Sinosporangium siamense]|uniref:Uncharacterized protein n=1 Tax=Sinosporangium siamense TaxID=1367973 RepID=A0A919RKV4_9ACTN|nr:hypothetical protein Ssi02_49310 [Sinosporangium siamense]